MSKSITIDGVEYIPKSEAIINKPATSLNGLPYVIARTYSAGVFAGYIQSRKGQEGTILNARRLWYWKGAASLSQLAVDGVSSPDECKFPCEVPQVELTQIIEIISVSKKAQESIASVPIWKK